MRAIILVFYEPQAVIINPKYDFFSFILGF